MSCSVIKTVWGVVLGHTLDFFRALPPGFPPNFHQHGKRS
jgi:hypothetical protein